MKSANCMHSFQPPSMKLVNWHFGLLSHAVRHASNDGCLEKLTCSVMFLGADWQLVAYKPLGVALMPATQLPAARAAISDAEFSGMAAAWMSGAERRARRGMAEICIFEVWEESWKRRA